LNVIIPQIKRVKIKTKLVHSGSEIPNLFHPMLERNAWYGDCSYCNPTEVNTERKFYEKFSRVSRLAFLIFILI